MTNRSPGLNWNSFGCGHDHADGGSVTRLILLWMAKRVLGLGELCRIAAWYLVPPEDRPRRR